MNWTTRHHEHYAKGHTTTYRITTYPTMYLLDCWYTPYGGWAMLGKAAFFEEACLFAECEEVYKQMGVP